MKSLLANVTTVVLTICAVIVTGLVVRREFFSAPATAAPAMRTIKDGQKIAATGSLMGPQNARLKIVEFSDFQCPFCASVRYDLQRIRDTYPGHVAVLYRHLPLQSIHPHAFAAALASECAGAQGRFEAYHDQLFEKQDSIGAIDWIDFAEAAGVPNLAEFRTCMEEERFEERVEEDLKAARAIGVDGTPSFVLNETVLVGATSLTELEKRVREALYDN